MVNLLRGHEDGEAYRAVFAAHPDPVALSPLAWVAAERGDLAGARSWIERFAADEFALIRSNLMPLVGCTFLAEACAAVDEAVHAEPLLRILAPHAHQWAVWAEGLPLGPMFATL